MDGTWGTREVARLAGVTSRTLRHYDAIGLLVPVGTDLGGERRYGEAELVRLQQILLLRELGLGLGDIAAALDADGGRGRVTTGLLRRHRDRLCQERERVTRLLATVDRTIEHLEEGTPMEPAELFDGFDPRRQAAYEREIVDRFGQDGQAHLDESRRRLGRMDAADASEIAEGFASVERRLAELLDAGVPPEDPRVQSVLVDHHALVSRFWTPDASSYAGLGRLYVDSPDFRDRYESVRQGLAEYLRDAMAVYAAGLPG